VQREEGERQLLEGEKKYTGASQMGGLSHEGEWKMHVVVPAKNWPDGCWENDRGVALVKKLTQGVTIGKTR